MHTHTYTEIQTFQGHQVHHKSREVPGPYIDKTMQSQHMCCVVFLVRNVHTVCTYIVFCVCVQQRCIVFVTMC